MSTLGLVRGSVLLCNSPLAIGKAWRLETFTRDASEQRQEIERRLTHQARHEFKNHLESAKSPCSSCDHAKISMKTISVQEQQSTTVSMNCELGSHPVCPHDAPEFMPMIAGLPDYPLPKRNKDTPQSVSSDIW